MRPQVSILLLLEGDSHLTQGTGPRHPKGNRRDGPHRHHDQAARDEEQLQVSRLSWTSSGSARVIVQGRWLIRVWFG